MAANNPNESQGKVKGFMRKSMVKDDEHVEKAKQELRNAMHQLEPMLDESPFLLVEGEQPSAAAVMLASLLYPVFKKLQRGNEKRCVGCGFVCWVLVPLFPHTPFQTQVCWPEEQQVAAFNSVIIPLDDLFSELRAELNTWRATKCGQWCLKIYKMHRLKVVSARQEVAAL